MAKVKIPIRGDSGFARDESMVWCEAHWVEYVLGLAKNPRLIWEIEEPLEQIKEAYVRT